MIIHVFYKVKTLKRESVRAQLRILVRRTLQKYKYPPDQAADAIELVLKQAEALSNKWGGQL